MFKSVWTTIAFVLIVLFAVQGCSKCSDDNKDQTDAINPAGKETAELVDAWEIYTEIRIRERNKDGVYVMSSEKNVTTGVRGKSRVDVLDMNFSEALPELQQKAMRQQSISVLHHEKAGEMITIDALRRIYMREPGEYEKGKALSLTAVGLHPDGKTRNLAGLDCDVWVGEKTGRSGTSEKIECWTKSRNVPYIDWDVSILPDDGYTMPLWQKTIERDALGKIVSIYERIVQDVKRTKIDPDLLDPPPNFSEVSPEAFMK